MEQLLKFVFKNIELFMVSAYIIIAVLIVALIIIVCRFKSRERFIVDKIAEMFKEVSSEHTSMVDYKIACLEQATSYKDYALANLLDSLETRVKDKELPMYRRIGKSFKRVFTKKKSNKTAESKLIDGTSVISKAIGLLYLKEESVKMGCKVPFIANTLAKSLKSRPINVKADAPLGVDVDGDTVNCSIIGVKDAGIDCSELVETDTNLYPKTMPADTSATASTSSTMSTKSVNE